MWFWRLRATSAVDFLIRANNNMKFGPVIHVVTDPLVCAIRPMPRINEINHQSDATIGFSGALVF